MLRFGVLPSVDVVCDTQLDSESVVSTPMDKTECNANRGHARTHEIP